jgi:hypothetical protein
MNASTAQAEFCFLWQSDGMGKLLNGSNAEILLVAFDQHFANSVVQLILVHNIIQLHKFIKTAIIFYVFRAEAPQTVSLIMFYTRMPWARRWYEGMKIVRNISNPYHATWCQSSEVQNTNSHHHEDILSDWKSKFCQTCHNVNDLMQKLTLQSTYICKDPVFYLAQGSPLQGIHLLHDSLKILAIQSLQWTENKHNKCKCKTQLNRTMNLKVSMKRSTTSSLFLDHILQRSVHINVA